MTISVRLPPRVEQALARYCAQTRKTKSEVIVELLEQHLTREEQPKTAYELAVEAGFIGSFEGSGEAAGPYKARVRAAIEAKRAA